MATEFLTEVQFGGRDYILRANPKGMPQGVGSFSVWVAAFVHAWRWLKRERAWVIRVRAREEDPLGKIVYEEELPDWRTTGQRVDELRDKIRAGKLPWVGEQQGP